MIIITYRNARKLYNNVLQNPEIVGPHEDEQECPWIPCAYECILYIWNLPSTCMVNRQSVAFNHTAENCMLGKDTDEGIT